MVTKQRPKRGWECYKERNITRPLHRTKNFNISAKFRSMYIFLRAFIFDIFYFSIIAFTSA